MRVRTVLLFAIALLLAGGTAIFARSWLTQHAPKVATNKPPPSPRAVLVARAAITRGQILKPTDFSWQPWPAGPIDPAYILRTGTRRARGFAGWVAREPFSAGEPITTAQIVAPGDRGFLAAVLRPGMRAISVPVTATSGISGFIFPGVRVDILVTQTVPARPGSPDPVAHKEAETFLHDIRVLAIDQRLASKNGKPALAHTATLEVTPKQSEIIAVASDMGRLSLSLRGLADIGRHKRPDSAPTTQGPTFTVDSEVNPLLPKLFTGKGNQDTSTITVLRGDSKSEHVAVSQPPSRGV